MATTLSNVNLIVSNIARARDFYVARLGLTEDAERSAPPHFCFLRGACALTLQEAGALGEAPGAGTGIEIGLRVDDLEAVARSLREAGYAPEPIEQMDWGRALKVRDPDGYRLNIFAPRNAW